MTDRLDLLLSCALFLGRTRGMETISWADWSRRVEEVKGMK